MASESLNFNLLAKDSASRVFDKVGNAAQGTESKFNKVNRTLATVGKVAARGAVVFGTLGAAGALMGLKTAASMEQAKISFTTMLGSAKKADKFLKQLADFAAKTPFEFPELQTAASSLISAGFNAKQVIPIMTTLGDVTSGMGTGAEGVQRATVALQQMSAAGKITGEDLNQLRDAGVPVFDLLASATGKSKAKIAELAAAGKLGKKEMQELFDALGSGKGLERFDGLMEKQSHSLTGLWSTFKDTLGMGLAKAIEPALPGLKRGLETITSLIGTALAAIPNIVAGIKDFAGPIVAKIKEAIPGIVAAFGPVWTGLRDALVKAFTWTSGIVSAIQSGDWAAVGAAFGDALSKAASGAAGLTKALRAWIAGVDWMALGKAASAAAVPFIIAFANDLALNFLKFTKAHPMDALTFVLTVIPVGRVAGILEKVLGKLPIIGPILRGLAGAGGAVENVMGKVFGFIGKALDHVAPGIMASLRSLGDRIVFRIFSWGVDMAAAAAHAGRSVLIAILRPFAGIGDRFASLGADLVRGFISGINSMVHSAVAAAVNLAKSAWEGATGFLRSHSPSRLMMEVGFFFSEGFALGIKGGTAKAIEAVKALTDKVTSRLQDLRSKAASIRQTAADAVRGMFNFGDIGAVTTGTDADGNPTSSTASPVQQFADFANQSRQFAAAVSAAVAKGINPAIIAGTANTGNLTAVSALAALDPSSVQSVNRDFALAQKFAAQVGQTVLSTTPLPAQIAREEAMLTELRAVKDALKNHKTVVDIDIDGKRFARAVARDIRKELDNMTQRRGGDTLAPKR